MCRLLSYVLTLYSMCVVLGHGHGHSHGGDGHGHRGHGHAHNGKKERLEEEWGVVRDSRLTRLKQESSENINVRAAFLHVIGDLIQSIGVVIAGYIIWFRVSTIEASATICVCVCVCVEM